MSMKGKWLLFFVALILLSSFASGYGLLQEQLNGATDRSVGNGAGQTKMARTFLANDSYNVGAITLTLSKVGTPTGNIYVEIFTVDGSKRPETLLGTSNNTYSMASIGAAAEFNFTFLPLVTVSNNTRYAISLGGVSTDAGNYINVLGGANASEQRSVFDGSTWSAIDNENHVYKIYGNTVTNSSIVFNDDLVNNDFFYNVTNASYSEYRAIDENVEYLDLSEGNYTVSILDGTSKVFQINNEFVKSSLDLSYLGNNSVTFTDANTGNPLSGDSITIVYPNGNSASRTTNGSGVVQFPSYNSLDAQNGTYNITFQDKQGYITPILFERSYTLNNLPFSENFQINRTNLNFTFRDAVNSSLIEEDLTVIISGIGQFNVSVGFLNISNISLANQEYTVSAVGTNYFYNQKTFTFTNQENLDVDLFLFNRNETNLGLVTVEVVDGANYFISEADVRMQEYNADSDSFTEVAQSITNSNGQAFFRVLLEEKAYRFLAIKEIDDITYTGYSTQDGAVIYNDGELFTITLDTISEFVENPVDNLQVNVFNVTLVNNVSFHQVQFLDPDGTSHTVCLEYLYINGLNEDSLLKLCETGASGTISQTGGYSLNRNYTNIVEVYVQEDTYKRYFYRQVYPSIESFENLFTILIKPIIAMLILAVLSIALYWNRIDVFVYGSIIINALWTIIVPSYVTGTFLSLHIILSLFVLYLAKQRSAAESV